MRPKNGGRLRLARSLRGAGTLLWGKQGARFVTYAIAIYRQGGFYSGNGDVSGDLACLVNRAPADVRLRLAGGVLIPLALTGIESDGATIDLIPPISLEISSSAD
jgi:hypothetical protein